MLGLLAGAGVLYPAFWVAVCFDMLDGFKATFLDAEVSAPSSCQRPSRG